LGELRGEEEKERKATRMKKTKQKKEGKATDLEPGEEGGNPRSKLLGKGKPGSGQTWAMHLTRENWTPGERYPGKEKELDSSM